MSTTRTGIGSNFRGASRWYWSNVSYRASLRGCGSLARTMVSAAESDKPKMTPTSWARVMTFRPDLRRKPPPNNRPGPAPG